MRGEILKEIIDLIGYIESYFPHYFLSIYFRIDFSMRKTLNNVY